jgi:capsular exopolysaccharide synthesis family protein
LVFPAGFIYGRTALKNRITTRYEIENATGTNVFGEFSYQHDAKGLVALDKENFEIGEQFRSFRTNLNILNQSAAKGWVCLFTSSIPNEGKSFVSSNLALVLAGSGKKVALLEMDLRKPKITPLFGLSATHPGISDYVAGRVPLGKVVQPSKQNPNLHIIGSGSVTEDPSELLESNEVATLISALKENYDYILIDTPPINLVTDAKILARYTNTIFYIIRQGFTYKSLLPFISELRAESLFDNMKIVFNGVEKGKYGYGYSYGNYYYQAGKNPAKKKSSSSLRRLLRRF